MKNIDLLCLELRTASLAMPRKGSGQTFRDENVSFLAQTLALNSDFKLSFQTL